MPALVHEDRSIADSCVNTPVSNATITINQQKTSASNGGTTSFLLRARVSIGRVCVTTDMRTIAAITSPRASVKSREPTRLDDGQRSITVARSCEPWMLSSLEKAFVGIRNQGSVDLHVFGKRKCALPPEFEERSERILVTSSCREGPHSSPFQDDFPSRHIRCPPCASNNVVVQKPPVLTWAQAVAS